MATTHIFIVNSKTFDIHLKYLFAGTGSKEHLIDFNNSENSSLHHSVENMLVAMSSDACRIRKDDKIIFYLQQEKGIREGKFYGIFKATSNWSFLDNNDNKQHLKDNLGKSLMFRTLIEPYYVYAEGVTEWEALDEIKNVQSPNQMLWSLIYRKLKGNRGNTMITIYEAERLTQLIRNKNGRDNLNIENKQLSFDKAIQQIIVNETPNSSYSGRQEILNILPRLISKFSKNRAFEVHLQSYIVQNIGLGINHSMDKAILEDDSTVEWIGNEVSCGVGMQRIDVAISILKDNHRVFIPIELKAVEASVDNIRQINRYIDWIEQYYIPNRQSDITPVIIAKEYRKKSKTAYSTILEKFRNFNRDNNNRCSEIKYIEYSIKEGNLIFNNVIY